MPGGGGIGLPLCERGGALGAGAAALAVGELGAAAVGATALAAGAIGAAAIGAGAG